MKHARLAVLLVLLPYLPGCCSVNNSRPIAEFKYKCPVEFSKYTYIYPVNLDTYRALVGERQVAVVQVVEMLERKFREIKGVAELAKQVMQEEGKARQGKIELFRELEKLSANGGAVCQFEWSDGQTRESGLLVLKGGVVLKRHSWFIDYIR